ncbi:phage tail tape measure protein, partial [Vibrio anguillarum]|nr:phage tail tape measure protein [Vibrio anguillarum]
FVAASYDIQSAIAGLDGNELSQFTKASGVLAAATKADTGTITSYMGTMYGIFKNQAEEMGKGAWVEEVAGMTASAVQMFKTTGSEMSSAFTSVGANATSAGIAMSEQMAILGTLQATMSGSEAGTKYKSFLAGVGAAQQKLNLGFTDSQGKMLPMLDILDKLKGKLGDTLDVAESDELKKAFGSDEAVSLIKLLMADTQG